MGIERGLTVDIAYDAVVKVSYADIVSKTALGIQYRSLRQSNKL
jgi:hypothetical protein